MDKSLSLSFEDTGSQSYILNDFSHVPKPSKCGKPSKSAAAKVKNVRNFDKVYLKLALWPDRASSAVRQANYRSQQKIIKLKSELNKENCLKCQGYKEKLQSTKLSLFHALDLCSTMLKEISKTNN
jgi:hypothetical protein